MKEIPPRLGERPRDPDVAGRQSNRQVRPRAGVLQRVELSRVEPIAALGQGGQVGLPRLQRVGLVQPAQPADRVPQARRLFGCRKVGKHARRPPRARRGDDRPVDLVAGDVLAKWPDGLPDGLLDRRDDLRGRILEQVGIVGVDRQHRIPRLHVLNEGLRQPARERRERLARRVRHARELLRLVAPERLDIARARLVGTGHDLPHERRRLERDAAVGERADDQEALAGLEVERDPDGEIGVSGELIVVVQGAGFRVQGAGLTVLRSSEF